jgi:hypothetical protein
MGDTENVTNELGDLPEAKTDEIDRAPGGVDATVLESDTGAGAVTQDPDTDLLDDSAGTEDVPQPMTPDQPLSAQQEEEKVPDAIQEPEEPEPEEQETDNTGGEAAPSG